MFLTVNSANILANENKECPGSLKTKAIRIKELESQKSCQFFICLELANEDVDAKSAFSDKIKASYT